MKRVQVPYVPTFVETSLAQTSPNPHVQQALSKTNTESGIEFLRAHVGPDPG